MKTVFWFFLTGALCSIHFSGYGSDSFTNYFEVLGVSQDASETEIIRAHAKLIREHHPDTNPEIKELEKELEKLKNNRENLQKELKKPQEQGKQKQIESQLADLDKKVDEKAKELAELHKKANKKAGEIIKAKNILSDSDKREQHKKDIKERKNSFQDSSSQRASGQGYQDSTDHRQSSEDQQRAYTRTNYTDFSYTDFRSRANNKPFFGGHPPINIDHIPNAEKILSLFYLILANDLHFKEAFSGSAAPDKKDIARTKKLSEAALKEILRTMGISNMKKQSFQRILSDFYHNFSGENLKEILKESERYNSQKQTQTPLQNRKSGAGTQEVAAKKAGALGRRDFLAQAFLGFIAEVKEWYAVQNLMPQERKAIEIFHTLSFVNQSPSETEKEEARYRELLEKRGKRFPFRRNPLTTEEKRELKAFERQNASDLRIFRNILSALGLPKNMHNDMLLKSYLEGLKALLTSGHQGQESSQQQRASTNRSSVSGSSGKNLSLFKSGAAALSPFTMSGAGGGSFFKKAPKTGAYRIYIQDSRALKIIRDIKVNFDNIYYENLKQMSPVLSANFLKRFPTQFILFHAALGAAVYREMLTDPLVYGAEKNPDMLMETATHSLSPSGLVSFAIFVAVSQQVHYRLYGLGRWMDGKALRTPFGNISFNGKAGRALAPSAALAAGYFAYGIFTDLMNDRDLKQCVKNQFSSKEELEGLERHIDPCDSLALTWFEGEKWKHYAVDGVTLLFSGYLSHRMISQIVSSLQPLNPGGLLFRSGKFIAMRTHTGIAIQTIATIYTFIELHQILDEWVGKPAKEQITKGGIKNRLVELSSYLDSQISYLDSLNGIELADKQIKSKEDSKFLKGFADKFKEKTAKISYKFKKWAEIRDRSYNQSLSLWNRQLNQVTLPYNGASDFLKDMFLSSHLKYGFDLKPSSPDWDSDGELVSDEKGKPTPNQIRWRKWNSEILSFSFLSFKDMREDLKLQYCSQAFFEYGWKRLCEGSYDIDILSSEYETYGADYLAKNYHIHIPSLIYETSVFILEKMEDFSQNRETEAVDFRPYIGMGLEEMFSADYSMQNFSGRQRFQLSRTLIAAGLDLKNSLSHFSVAQKEKWRSELCSNWHPQHKTEEDAEILSNSCLIAPAQAESYCKTNYSHSEKSYTACINSITRKEAALSQKISAKLLGAGLYILKKDILDVLRQGRYRSDLTHVAPYEELINSPDHYFALADLTNLLEVYKKGERHFAQKDIYLENLKQNAEMDPASFEALAAGADPYRLTYSLICANSENNREDRGFVIPRFFSLPDLSLYDLPSKQFIGLQELCEQTKAFWLTENKKKKDLHRMLFRQPASVYGERYENLYLALESLLSRSHSSSQKVKEAFERLSQDQLKGIGSRLSADLNLLTENYYKGLVNRESAVHSESSLQDFDSYYRKEKIFFDIRSFTGEGIRGLEISLVQIRYWMDILERLLKKGEALYFIKEKDGEKIPVSFNKERLWMTEDFNEGDFESMRWKILSLLQSYHDTYKKQGGPYLLLPDEDFKQELNDVFNKEYADGLADKYQGVRSRLQILETEYPSSLPVLMPPDVILSEILEFSIPDWNVPAVISNLNSNPKLINQNWEKIIYSVVFEINNSLNRFFSQMQILSFKETVDHDLTSLGAAHLVSD